MADNTHLYHLYKGMSALYLQLAEALAEPAGPVEVTPQPQAQPQAQPAFNPANVFGAQPQPQPANVVQMPPAQATPAAAQVQVNLEDVRNALATLQQHKSPDAVIQILQSFGVQKLSGLTPEQYPQVIAMAHQAMSGGAA